MYDRDYVSSGFSMTIIDAIKMQDGSKTLEVLNDPHKKYRTLYFENNVDVRLCTKNGNTTLRSVWSQLYHGSTVNCTTGVRKALYEKYKEIDTIDNDLYILRKNSYRIAVKRDPIERSLSAAKEVLKQRLNILDPSLDMIEELLLNCDSNLDHHFLSQTYWMGNAYDYDEVYDVQDLENLVKWLECDYNYPFKITDSHMNKSPSNIKVIDLSNKVIDKVYKTYEIDYRNGWF